MPFQSEKQRRYLWANEPEIARDWTNTYGHRTRGESGGIMHRFENYANEDGDNISVPRSFQARPYSEQVNLAYITPQEEGVLQRLRPGTPHRGPMEVPNYDSFDAKGGYATSGQLDAPTAGDIQAGVGSGGAGAGGERTHRGPLSTTVAPGQTVSAAEAWKAAQPAQRDYRAANQLAWQNRQGAWNLREPYRQSTSYYKPRKGIGGFFKGLGKGIGNLAMMFNPWTAGLGIMGNPKTAAFLNLMGRGKNRLQGNLADWNERRENAPKTLAEMFGWGKYGKDKIIDEDIDVRMKTLQDPDLETDEEKEFRRRYPLDLTPDYMHDLEAKAPTKKREQDFDLNDPSTWYDTHPATGESVMTPGFKKHYQGPSKLNPRRVEDSYEYMEERNPYQAEVWQRPHTFGQEHEWYPSNPDEVDESIDSNIDPTTFAQGDDLSGIEGHQAKLGKLPLIQMRILEKKVKAPGIYGKPTPKEEEQYKKLKKMMESETMYSLPLIG